MPQFLVPFSVARGYTEVTDEDSGIVFRFLDDLAVPTRLHIEAAHGVTPEQAVESFNAGVERTTWLEHKRCFETISADYVVVWLWLDEACTRVLVITCVPRADSDYA